MQANTLCTLIAQRIDPKQFWLSGLEIVWLMETRLPPIEGETSPFDTPENNTIVAEIEANYDTLAAAYEKQLLMADVASAVQSLLDSTAQQRGYDNIFTLISYVTSTNPVFQREGQVGLFWRDRVWEACLQIKNDVIAGNRPLPTIEEVLAEMPVIVWGE